MDNFYAQFAKQKLYPIVFPLYHFVVYSKVWLKVQIGEMHGPTLWQAIDTLPISVKVSQFVQDASLVLQNYVLYVTSLMIFSTPGINSLPQKDGYIRFLYTPPFGKAPGLQ